jgi:hypothetical protein
MYKNIRIPILLILIASAIFSCKKSSDTAAVFYLIDKGAALSSSQTSIKDTFYVTRQQLTANFSISANTQDINVQLKRFYVFKRNIDNPSIPGNYTSIQGTGYIKDGNGNYYYRVSTNTPYNDTIDITVLLRAFNNQPIEDEYFFIFTNDTDFAGPSSTTGVILGPVQFYVKYGKLTEYPGLKMYNHAYNDSFYFSNYDVEHLYFKYQMDSSAEIDISEKTAPTPLFLGKFKARNNTTFVKAPANFPYANATDVDAARFFAQGTPFSETPDSIGIGDIYLINIRGTKYQYAAMKILYIVPENGKTGPGFNKEYFLFNLKR